MSLEPLHILGSDGVLVAEAPVSLGRTRELYAQMVTGRGYDRKASAMQRQGRLATYAQFEGQEACQIGAVAPLAARRLAGGYLSGRGCDVGSRLPVAQSGAR